MPNRYLDPEGLARIGNMELVARQGLHEGAVLVRERLEDGAVEVLVDEEMAQAPRRHHAHPRLAWKRLDRAAHRLAEPVAAARRRLVRRVVGVDRDRHDRNDVFHDPLVDKADRVPLAFA